MLLERYKTFSYKQAYLKNSDIISKDDEKMITDEKDPVALNLKK